MYVLPIPAFHCTLCTWWNAGMGNTYTLHPQFLFLFFFHPYI